MSFTDRLNAAAGAATCSTLDQLGGSLINAGTYALVVPGAQGLAAKALGFGAIANLASKLACTWDSTKGDPSPITPGDFCKKSNGGMAVYYVNTNGPTPKNVLLTGDADSIDSIVPFDVDDPGGQYWVYFSKGMNTGGAIARGYQGGPPKLVTEQNEGSTCEEPWPDYKNPFPDVPPTTYTDPETGCVLEVEIQGMMEDETGTAQPVYKIGPGAETRSGGGVIGGCNFSPVIYYGDGGDGGGGGTYYGPWEPFPDDDGEPWWVPWVRQAVGGVVGGATGALVRELLEPRYDPLEYVFIAPCDKDAEGKPLERVWPFVQQKQGTRMIDLQMATLEVLQQHLDWKTPICFGNEGKGDYRTISFISVESSPYGNNRLRKRFRYRSQSGIGLDGVVDHWKDFAFDAGDVCVQHRGSALGSPQVWAASANEGKRVILHAAGEAGIDPNQVGEWSIGGSDNPRYGVFGRMIVNTKGGYYWISSRLGENGRPLVGSTS